MQIYGENLFAIIINLMPAFNVYGYIYGVCKLL